MVVDVEMIIMKGRLLQGLKGVLVVYLIMTFYMTVVSRKSFDKERIQTEWLEGYKSVHYVYGISEIGAMIGGLIAVAVIYGTQRHKDIHLSLRRGHSFSLTSTRPEKVAAFLNV